MRNKVVLKKLLSSWYQPVIAVLSRFGQGTFVSEIGELSQLHQFDIWSQECPRTTKCLPSAQACSTLNNIFLNFKSFPLLKEKTLRLKIWFNNCERLSLIKCALFGLLAGRSTLDREADLQKSNLDPCGAPGPDQPHRWSRWKKDLWSKLLRKKILVEGQTVQSLQVWRPDVAPKR